MIFCSQVYDAKSNDNMSMMKKELVSDNVSNSDTTLHEHIDEVRQYTSSMLKQYFSGDALKHVSRIFENFINGHISNVDVYNNDIDSLNAKDMMHLSWNIWRRTNNLERNLIAKFLKRTFPTLFKELSVESIYRKMTNDDGFFRIPIIKTGSLLGNDCNQTSYNLTI
jgi:transcriptional regulator with GAF, ATPase, and Fis domain